MALSCSKPQNWARPTSELSSVCLTLVLNWTNSITTDRYLSCYKINRVTKLLITWSRINGPVQFSLHCFSQRTIWVEQLFKKRSGPLPPRLLPRVCKRACCESLAMDWKSLFQRSFLSLVMVWKANWTHPLWKNGPFWQQFPVRINLYFQWFSLFVNESSSLYSTFFWGLGLI